MPTNSNILYALLQGCAIAHLRCSPTLNKALQWSNASISYSWTDDDTANILGRPVQSVSVFSGKIMAGRRCASIEQMKTASNMLLLLNG